MKIGRLVQHYIPEIFAYCEKVDHDEFQRLCDRTYAKRTLDINFPFCKPIDEISTLESRRYWSQTHVVRGVSVRVTSQWVEPPTSKSRPRLIQYLQRLGIDLIDAARHDSGAVSAVEPPVDRNQRLPRGRFKGNAIGNAQNLLVRNILSNLGSEAFSESDWHRVIESFEKRCAYCGEEGELLMDHVVPINKQALGEHRLGNLVPSCKSCNSNKGDKNFDEFLASHPDRIAVIEAHMERNNYIPISDNAQIRQIIDLAHKEVSQVASRYVEIINTLLTGQKQGVSDDG